MSESPQDAAVHVHLTYIRAAVDGINARLDKQNGRIGEVEEDVAVLKDRSDEAKQTGRTWGAVSGGLGAVVVALLDRYMGPR